MHFFLILIFILGGLGNSFFQGVNPLSAHAQSCEFKAGLGIGSGANNFPQGFAFYSVQ
jgi:hypothetical protein